MSAYYRSPVLPPPAELAKRTATLRERLDALEASMHRARPLVVSRLQDQDESARQEILRLCDQAEKADEMGDDAELRLTFYAQFRDAVREFCTALAAVSPERKAGAFAAARESAREAIAIVDRLKR